MKLPIILEGSRQHGYTVTCPPFPGCVSEGDTREEAIKNIREAIRPYLRAVTREPTLLRKARASKKMEVLEVAVQCRASLGSPGRTPFERSCGLGL